MSSFRGKCFWKESIWLLNWSSFAFFPGWIFLSDMNYFYHFLSKCQPKNAWQEFCLTSSLKTWPRNGHVSRSLANKYSTVPVTCVACYQTKMVTRCFCGKGIHQNIDWVGLKVVVSWLQWFWHISDTSTKLPACTKQRRLSST
jgi:hypothetical protein